METRNQLPPLPNNSTSPVVEPPPTPAPQPAKKAFKFTPILFLLVGLFFVFSVFAFGFFLGGNRLISSTLPTPTPQLSLTPSPTSESTPTLAPTSQPTKFGSISWLDSPKPITLPNLAKTKDDIANRAFEVGSFSSGAKFVLYEIPPLGPGGSSLVHLVVSDNNQNISWVTNITESWTDMIEEFFVSSVKKIELDIKELSIPDHIVADSKTFTKHSLFSSPKLFSDLKNATKIADSQQGPIYVTYQPMEKDQNILTRNLYLKLKDFTLLPLKLQSGMMISDDRVPAFYFPNNQKNATQYMYGINYSSCGGGTEFTIIRDGNSVLDSKVAIGGISNPGQNDVYQIKDQNSSIVKTIYDIYKMGRDYPSSPPYLPINKFAAETNHILFKDALGDWNLMLNGSYTPMVECGKPVIYLYPTAPTAFNLQVGANITVSEPLYPATGWSGTANPDGKITIDGHDYPYLFWEGQGIGEYANLSNYGTIVKSAQVKDTLTAHLKQMNLNEKEIADFLEFWIPKMPTSKYVRLTWLQTPEMNRLAPLKTSFKADSSIRVFLEFEGMDSPKSLKLQQLVRTPRRGFTLVEWGGLMIKAKN